ncbi:MAG: AraC family transcriptional regulator [Pararhodobacter sp.]|nr:AraC family transcriptional regulator [Pararhodobacter sp.]
MSETSEWPLPEGSYRLVAPPGLCQDVQGHPLGQHFVVSLLCYYHEAWGHSMIRTTHDEHLVVYVLRGKGQLCLTNEPEVTYELGAGDLWWVPPNIPHHYRSSETTPWTVYGTHLRANDAEALRHLLGLGEKPVRNIGVRTELIDSFEAILMGIRQNGFSFSTLLLASMRMRALLTVAYVLAAQNQESDQLMIENLHAFMRLNIHRRVPLEEMAEQCHLSKYHFIRKYKKLTGRTPMQKFQQMKVEAACQLLDKSHDSISRIADSLGFQDNLYFSRVFTSVMGVSPSRFRTK